MQVAYPEKEDRTENEMMFFPFFKPSVFYMYHPSALDLSLANWYSPIDQMSDGVSWRSGVRPCQVLCRESANVNQIRARLRRILGELTPTGEAGPRPGEAGNGRDEGEGGLVTAGEVGGLISLVGRETVDPTGTSFRLHQVLQPRLVLFETPSASDGSTCR